MGNGSLKSYLFEQKLILFSKMAGGRRLLPNKTDFCAIWLCPTETHVYYSQAEDPPTR